MTYYFSWNWFFIGIVVLAAGVALTVWYRPIADSIASGVSSYEKFRLYGLIACLLGFVVMLNLHTMLLNWFFGMLFGGGTA